MGQYTIKMPDIGEGIAEVELVAWHIKEGDQVKEDQVIADVMTDKATVEIPSPVTGTVLALGASAGTMMSVGAELIRLEVQGEGNLKGAHASTQPEDQGAAAPAARPSTRVNEARDPSAASTLSSDRAAIHETPPTWPLATPAPTRAPREQPLASPAVRQRAWEMGIELQFVHGSGPAGRITHQDLDVYVASRGRAPQTSDIGEARYTKRDGETAVPVIGLRRKIAQKMQEAKRRIPHFTYVEEVDVTELEGLRLALNARYGGTRGKLTLLPLLVRATVLALTQFPQMNARFDDDQGVLTRYAAVHLGIATQTGAGLMVPVLRHAESKDPWACAQEIARLAEAARSGKATREELAGSTLTISSLGALGGVVTTPVINYPEVTILGVNRIVDRPTIQGSQVVARKLMNLSSSFDHRVIDGMEAAEFIQAIRAMLEEPALLFVE